LSCTIPSEIVVIFIDVLHHIVTITGHRITNHHLADKAAGAAFSIIVTAVVMVVIVGCRQYRVNDHRFQYQQRNKTPALERR
jgi:hypothetical protein